MLETLAMLSDAQPQLQPHPPLAILVDPLSAWHRREPHWGHSLFQQGCRPASDFRDQPVLQLPHRHRFQQRSVCDQCRCPDDGLCQQWLDFFGRLWCGVLVPIPDRHRLLHLRFSRHQSQLATPAWAGLMAAERPTPARLTRTAAPIRSTTPNPTATSVPSLDCTHQLFFGGYVNLPGLANEQGCT